MPSGLPAPTMAIEKAKRNSTYTTRKYATSIVIFRKILTIIARRPKSAKLRSNLRYMQKMLRLYQISPEDKGHLNGALSSVAKTHSFRKPMNVGST
jgi:hypothetical protein